MIRDSDRLAWMALATCLGALILAPSGRADDSAPAVVGTCPDGHQACSGPHGHDGPGYGTLGYGGPGFYPGFQGFGLGYHPGYGYGGQALGVGAQGGYPFYGGPGYPHPWPRLRRFGGITPFPYYGGPGQPTPRCPNFYGIAGPLVPDPPVVTVQDQSGGPAYTGTYGGFDGMIPYPESTFAPFVSIAAEGASSSRVITPNPSQRPAVPAPGRVP